MAITTYNTDYFDDLNIPDSNGLTPLDKNYLRVLFKPGVSVQTRELNQLQSAIQAQLDHVGESIFRSGKPVLGGVPQFESTSKISSLDFTANSDEILEVGESINSFVTIYRTGDEAFSGSIVEIKPISTVGNSVIYRVYYKITSLSESVDNNFIPSDSITISYIPEESEPNATRTISGFVNSVNLAVGAYISSGVYFTKGSYVVLHEQKATYDIPTGLSKFSGYVVLKITETIENAVNDTTLNDNASGSYNYAQPGADRYAISLDLSLVPSLPDDDSDYIVLLTVQNDIVIVDNINSGSSSFDDKLAQRTYEESGNYEVYPFPINITEAYNDGTNGGLYSATDLVNAGYAIGNTTTPDIQTAQNDLAVQLDPSVAYVKGYRIELKNKIPLKLPKAREVASDIPAAISADMGMYVDVELGTNSKIPDVQSANKVYTFTYSYYTVGSLGTARIRSIESLGSNRYRIFLYDVNVAGNTIIDNNISLVQSVDGVVLNILEPIQKTDNPYGLFKLPYAPVQSISDLRFTYKKRSTFTATGTTITVAVTAQTGEVIDSSPTNIIVQRTRGGTTTTLDTASLGITSTSNTLSFILDDSLSGDVITVINAVTTDGLRGTKTLTSATLTPAALAAYSIGSNLYRIPVYHMVSINSGPYEIVSDGQWPAHYTYAVVRYTGEGPLNVDLQYSYFQFSEGADFFDSSSYFTLVGSSQVPMPLEDIPKYDSIPLYSVLDFRYYYNPSNNAATVRPIDAYSPITFKSTHYLPRVDNVLISQTGSFYINHGKAEYNPKKPVVPDTSMELYVLNLAPYTFGPDDVKIQKIDNQRYTMSNIRAIDKRVSNLEYYTTLSLLEKTAKDTSILFDGVDRFKNGFVVDNFAGHNVGDPTNPDYLCAVDESLNELRPAFSTSSFKLDVLEDQSDGIQMHDRVATLKYTQTPYISQSYGTEAVSVNPYDSAIYVGKLQLYPDADYWIDTSRRPKVITKDDDNRRDGVRYLGENPDDPDLQALGSEWNSWETYWSGSDRFPPTASDWYNSPQSKKPLTAYFNKITTSESGAVIEKGNRVVNVTVRPYIRARYVYFKAHSLKPNTIYYPFFDGVNVTAHCYSRTSANFKKKNNKASRNGKPVPRVNNTNNTLKTDALGNLYGLFIIPNTTALRFLSGVRQFKLTDTNTNLLSQTTSYAACDYYATGLIKSADKAIVSNAVPEIPRTSIFDSRPSSGSLRISSGKKISWIDPIAQSFLINNPEGIFATSVDLYFATKPQSDIPVEVYIVTCENGIPTQNIVPRSTMIVNNDDVNVDNKGLLETRFTFEQPIYLAPGQEYALLVTSTSADYTLYVATLGKRDTATSQLVSSNPYNGVFFTSQNSSTWSPDQSKDLKFKLHRAKFDLSNGNIKFETTSVSSIESIEVLNQGSGYTAVPNVIIETPPGSEPTIPATATAILTGDKVSSILLSYDDNADGTSNGTGGGLGYTNDNITVTLSASPGTTATAVAILPSAKVSSFVLDQDAIQIVTVDEEDPTKQIQSSVSNIVTILGEQYNVEPNQTYTASLSKKEWTNPGVNYAYPVKVTTTLSTTSNYISPVVDIDRTNIKLIANRLLTNDTPTPTSKYITRSIQLAQLADQLDIYFDVNRPSTSCDIKVYVQFNDPSTREETDWIEIEQRVSPLILPTNSNLDEFSEVHYMIERGDEYPFNSFKVKIVFLSNNIVDAPRIKNFRAIATA